MAVFELLTGATGASAVAAGNGHLVNRSSRIADGVWRRGAAGKPGCMDVAGGWRYQFNEPLMDRSHWSAPFDHEARLCVAMLSIGIPGHCQNVDLKLLTPPLDGSSSGSHPTSHDIARAPRVAFPWPDRPTGRWTSLDDSARHGNAQHIRSGPAARSAHQRE